MKELPALLDKIPNRAATVLEVAVESDQLTLAQANEAQTAAATFANQFGFEYSSYVGVHPLGSKGVKLENGTETADATKALKDAAASIDPQTQFGANASVRKLEQELALQEARLSDLKKRSLRKHPEYIATEEKIISLKESLRRMTEMANRMQPEAFRLNEALALEEARFAELKKRYRARHPEYMAAQERIASLRESLAKLNATHPGPSESQQRPNGRR
ncbi:MAG: hypothetical protein FJ403_22160 [Verrucomicrobia bacterium]|nr:hypothetical protein [Verrucomicrobiota bacterium]